MFFLVDVFSTQYLSSANFTDTVFDFRNQIQLESAAMAQLPGVAWDLRPDYVALTQRVDPAGIVTAYSKCSENLGSREQR